MSRLRWPIDDPAMGKFVRALGDVNWLAERSPGFVWRHSSGSDPVTYAELAGEGQVVATLSVWDDFESLQRFVTQTAHGLFMRQRGRWFLPLGGFTTALWWVRSGHQPALAEALGRLERLRSHGPTPDAFSLRRQFDAGGAPVR